MASVAAGHRYKFALAKQAAEGTAESIAEFAIPLFGGGFSPQEDRARFEVADGNAYRPGGYKSRAWVEGSPELACFPDSIGRLLMGHFGTDTKTGAADPYSHAFTRSDSPPWHTVWIARPKPDGTYFWERGEDVQIKTIEIAWAAGAPLRCTVGLIGKKTKGNVSAPTITTTNDLDNGELYYTSLDSVLNIDIDATPSVTQVRNIEAFTIHFGYDDEELIQTDELFPRFRDPGLWTVGYSADIVLEDYAAYLATFYGADNASDAYQSKTIVSGSLDHTINTAPTTNADRTLNFSLPALEFALTAPDPDVSGRAVRANLTAEIQKPASGEPATVTLENDRSTAY